MEQEAGDLGCEVGEKHEPPLMSPSQTRSASASGSPEVSALLSTNANDKQSTQKNDYIFIVVGDPQLGISRAFAPEPKDGQLDKAGTKDDYSREEKMFKAVTGFIPNIKDSAGNPARFVFLAGDMQDAWPKARGKPPGDMTVEKYTSNNNARAKAQREAAVEIMKTQTSSKWIVTPGNHDVDDVPSHETVSFFNDYYAEYRKNVDIFDDTGPIMFYELNSMVLQDPSVHEQLVKDEMRKFQTALQHRAKQGPVELIFMLTHVPPFMLDFHERHGWANWNQNTRDAIDKSLSTAFKASGARNPKVVWAAGHLHSNVVHENYPRPDYLVDIVVSGASGTAMYWGAPKEGEVEKEEAACWAKDNGWKRGKMLPEHAAWVASKRIQPAFVKYIVPDIGQRYQGSLPNPARSGARVFVVCGDQSPPQYFSRWFSIIELQHETTIAETPWWSLACTQYNDISYMANHSKSRETMSDCGQEGKCNMAKLCPER
jgi:hypothetical protein